MSSILTVTGQAADLALLTIEELRAATGLPVGDSSQDAALAILGTRVAARITAACNIDADGAIPPTLRQENLTETFRLGYGSHRVNLVLARRPIVSVASVEEEGAALTETTDYEIAAASGMLRRLSSDSPMCWRGGKIVVVYTAGWEVVPQGLKAAAERLAANYWAYQTAIEPGFGRVNIPGVADVQFSADALSAVGGGLPADVMEMLGPYRNYIVI